MYLFDSPQEFFDSPMFLGQRFYDAKHYRPWFGWIYIALYDHLGIEEYKKDPNPNVQIKIGRSTNIDRRNKELYRDSVQKGKVQKKASIVYAWSVPLEIKFESDLKTLLAAYIRQDNQLNASEIIRGIPIITLINVIQLSIFKTCLAMKFIRADMEFNLRPPDTIIDGNIEYPGKRKYMLPHQLVIQDVFSALDMTPKGNTESLKEYIFLQDKRIVDVPDTAPPEFEGEYLDETTHMSNNVYIIGTYVYAKYTDEDGNSGDYLAQIIGYGDKEHRNQYAVKWLVTERGRPIRTEDGLELSDDKWQWTKKVTSTQRLNPKLLKDFPELKVGNKKLRL